MNKTTLTATLAFGPLLRRARRSARRGDEHHALGRREVHAEPDRPGRGFWDGAKDEEVILQIMGVGPSATIRVDESGQPKK